MSCNIYSGFIKKEDMRGYRFILSDISNNEFKGACGSYRLTTCAGRAVLVGDGPFILSVLPLIGANKRARCSSHLTPNLFRLLYPSRTV